MTHDDQFNAGAAWMQRRVSTRGRLRAVAGAVGLLAGLGAARAAAPVAAANAPFIYYAGTSAQGGPLIGGALFQEPCPYVLLSYEPFGSVFLVHEISVADSWLYDGTWQFLTDLTPSVYADCTPYEGGFIYHARAWDPGQQAYSNDISLDICYEF